MNEKGLKTGAVIVEDNTEILGVNDRAQLELLTRVLRMRINAEHMKNRDKSEYHYWIRLWNCRFDIKSYDGSKR